jgi:hypothetical protein
MSKYILFILVILTLAIPYNVFADNSNYGQGTIPLVSINQNGGYFNSNTPSVQSSPKFMVDGKAYAIGDEVIEKRTENSKTTYLGKVGNKDKFALDTR